MTKRTDRERGIDIEMGRRLHYRRKQVGMSQEALGNACGVTFQQIQKYEHGFNRISCGRLVTLSAALGVATDYFFTGIEEAAAGNDAPPAPQDRLTLEASKAVSRLPRDLQHDIASLARALMREEAQ